MSFGGCGFLGMYHVGVMKAIKHFVPNSKINKICGTSAGAMAGSAFIGNIDCGKLWFLCNWGCFWSTRPTTVPAGSDHYFHTECPSVRPSHNFKVKRQSLPAGTVGWPSGSLMTPVFCSLFLALSIFQLYFLNIAQLTYQGPGLSVCSHCFYKVYVRPPVKQWPSTGHDFKFVRRFFSFLRLHCILCFEWSEKC